MPKVTEINPTEIRDILEKEMTPILNAHGLTFVLGNARYDADYIRFTGFRVSLENAEDPTAKALKEENEYRQKYGGKVLDLNKIGEWNQTSFSLVGYKPRNRKYPFICMNLENNQRYKFTKQQAEKMFAASKGDTQCQK